MLVKQRKRNVNKKSERKNMGILSIDTSNPDLLKKKNFDPIPPGNYTFEVENDLKIEDSKSSDSKVVKVELRVLDDGEYKGRKVFDNLVIGSTPEAKKNTEWKIAHFAFACGVAKTKEDLNEIELGAFKGCTCEAKIGFVIDEYKRSQGDEGAMKNIVKQYLFEDIEE